MPAIACLCCEQSTMDFPLDLSPLSGPFCTFRIVPCICRKLRIVRSAPPISNRLFKVIHFQCHLNIGSSEGYKELQ
jgi:hypothetical protein